ncbi:MAG: helix-turn-helix domain-containing protein [Prevotellaceae bacterium]|nr:helix-turn-helix domain-containing protein [Prevotellaceae bacterium]
MDKKEIQTMVLVPASEWEETRKQIAQLVEMQKENAASKDEYMPPKDVCAMLKIGRATFERHKNSGTIPVYSIAGTKRKYAKKSEILRLLHEGKL